MAILGVAKAVYGVDDLDKSTQFFIDYGLGLQEKTAQKTVFELEDGAQVILRKKDDPALPKAWFDGSGVKETIWAVDTQEALDRLAANLQTDREVRRDNDGTAHFLADDGMPQGLQVFRKRELVSAADEINTPARAARVNRNRTWRKRARPKSIAHVVFQVANPQASFKFFKERLGFRLSDTQRKLGCYARADGSHEHHNIFFFNADFLPPPVRKLGFNHTAFACDDIDEMMVGANYLELKGWATKRPGGFVGLGRHRISSALFYYIPCPAGGHAEYIADQDYLDDSWIPRDWEESFGGSIWMHDVPEHLKKPYSWDVKLHDEDAAQS
ncbi:MAG TPA: VOC family protein [Stellaceae bacterium]|jgi:catechol-2,3-dioxygenase